MPFLFLGGCSLGETSSSTNNSTYNCLRSPPSSAAKAKCRVLQKSKGKSTSPKRGVEVFPKIVFILQHKCSYRMRTVCHSEAMRKVESCGAGEKANVGILWHDPSRPSARGPPSLPPLRHLPVGIIISNLPTKLRGFKRPWYSADSSLWHSGRSNPRLTDEQMKWCINEWTPMKLLS